VKIAQEVEKAFRSAGLPYKEEEAKDLIGLISAFMILE
jgi:hypothetical protein